MKREFLKELGLEDSAIDKIMAENGNDINKAKASKEELEELKKQLSERDAQLEEIKTSVKNSEDLEKKIQELQETNKKSNADYEAKIKQMEINSILDLALVEAKAKNAKAVKSLLDLENVEIADGKIKGLEDQLKKLQDSDGYLFNTESKQMKGMTPSGGADTNGAKPDDAKSYGSQLANIALSRLGIKQTNKE